MPRNSFLFLGYFLFFFVLFFGAIELRLAETEIPPPENQEAFHEEVGGIGHAEVLTERDVAKIEDSRPSVRTPNYDSAPDPAFRFIIHTDLAIAETIQESLQKLLESSKLAPKVTPIRIELTDGRIEPRGKMSKDQVSLVVTLPTESETVKVFGHELGHVIDIQYLKEWRFQSDPSDDFYGISWSGYTTKKKEMKLADFVSGYAMTNQYEDFAESFAMYMFHNEIFQARTAQNLTLRRKYEFFRDEVFTDTEFSGTSFELQAPEQYFWDTTKIPITVNKYLYYLK